MFSGKRVASGFTGLLILVALPSCTADGSPSESSSPAPATSVNSASATPTIGRDGRTILPSAESQACALLSEAAVRDILGEVASSLGAPQSGSERAADGTTTDFCLYPFDEAGTTTNGLVIEILTYPSARQAADADPFALLPNAEDLGGLKHPAKFGINRFNESTEFVVASLQESRLFRLVAATPPSKAWGATTGKDTMKRLATAAGL